MDSSKVSGAAVSHSLGLRVPLQAQPALLHRHGEGLGVKGG